MLLGWCTGVRLIVHVSPGYVQSAAQRCGRKAVGYSYMYVVPGYYMYCTQRGGYTTSLLVPHWWCLVCTSSVTHSSQSQRYCRLYCTGLEASRIKSIHSCIRGNKGKIYKIGHKCPSWRVVVCTVCTCLVVVRLLV